MTRAIGYNKKQEILWLLLLVYLLFSETDLDLIWAT